MATSSRPVPKGLKGLKATSNRTKCPQSTIDFGKLLLIFYNTD